MVHGTFKGDFLPKNSFFLSTVVVIHVSTTSLSPDLEPVVDLAISSLRVHDFLWREDMHATYQTFLQTHPSLDHCWRHIERLVDVEKKVQYVLRY